MTWYGMVQYDMIHVIWYGNLRHCIIFYDMTWYGITYFVNDMI